MKKKISLMMLVLLALAWYVTYDSWIGNGIKAEEAIERAGYFEEKQLYLKAIEEYNTAISYRGKTEILLIAIADDYKKMGDDSGYKKALENTLSSYPESIAAITRFVNYYDENHQEKRKIELIKDKYNKFPENEEIKRLYDGLKGKYEMLYASYEEIGPYRDGYAMFCMEDRYGLIDEVGEIVLNPVYAKVGLPMGDDEWVPVSDESGSYYVSKEGYKAAVPDTEYASLGNLLGSAVLVEKNGKYGYINSELEEKTGLIYDNGTAIYNKLGAVCQNGKWALTNNGEKLLTEYVYDDVVMNEWGIASENDIVWVKQNGLYCLVDKKGEQISQETYDSVKAFEGTGYCAVCRDGKWGFADMEGNLVIACQFEDAETFHKGFAPVKQNGRWGFIDETGELIVPESFEMAYPPNDSGVAPVKTDGIWTLIQFSIYA